MKKKEEIFGQIWGGKNTSECKVNFDAVKRGDRNDCAKNPLKYKQGQQHGLHRETAVFTDGRDS